MIIQDSLKKFGDYVLLMRRVFTIPDRWREFFKRYIVELSSQSFYFVKTTDGIVYFQYLCLCED